GQHQPSWGDIIPAFDYPKIGRKPAGHFEGLNLNTSAGQSWLDRSCALPEPPAVTHLTLVKEVVNTGGGTADPEDWTLSAVGPTTLSGKTGYAAVTNAVVSPGGYALSESDGPSGYTASSWSCRTKDDKVGKSASSGHSSGVMLEKGDSVTCTITNTFVPPPPQKTHLTLVKEVVNTDGGTSGPEDWTLSAVGPTTLSGKTGDAAVSNAVVSPGGYTLSESGPSGYTSSAWSCGNKVVTANAVTLAAGESVSCTITNTFQIPNPQPAHLTLVKVVVNAHGGTASPSDWTLSAVGPVTISGASASTAVTSAALPAGDFVLSESAGPTGYTPSAWVCLGGTLNGDTITLASSQDATCTITNTEEAPESVNPDETGVDEPVEVLGTGAAVAPRSQAVVGGAAASPVLAFTGADGVVPLGIFGLIVLALGAGLAAAARRVARD
ncbi:MAG: hypothetical protein ABIP19_07060, partial [Dermatophilaceae bacterium]